MELSIELLIEYSNHMVILSWNVIGKEQMYVHVATNEMPLEYAKPNMASHHVTEDLVTSSVIYLILLFRTR